MLRQTPRTSPRTACGIHPSTYVKSRNIWNGPRDSRAASAPMSVREKDNPALYTRIQEQNLLRQYDLLSNCVEIALEKGIESFDKYTLWALNYAAVANIAQLGGRYREEPILVGNHIPPHFKDVPELMDRFFSLVHENWTLVDHP